jgi:membrane protein
MLISPVLLVIASSAMVVAAAQINQIMTSFDYLGTLAPVVNFIIMIIPYAVLWFLLSLLYMFLPYAKVRFLSGLIGGICAGTAFVAIQAMYITFQIGVARFNAIYGSFAALPLFIVWLYVSWLIVLAGFELTYAHQHVHIYEYEPDTKKASASFRMLASLQVMHAMVKNFMQGGKPLSRSAITHRLALPPLLTGEIMENLRSAGLIVAVVPEGKQEHAYQPARDIDIFTIAYVQRALTHSGLDDLPVEETDAFERLRSSLQAFESLIDKADANVRLKDI